MFDPQSFIKSLEEENSVIDLCLDVAEKEKAAYYRGKIDANNQIIGRLKMSFNDECKYRILGKERSFDHCKIMYYCDPRTCKYKEK